MSRLQTLARFIFRQISQVRAHLLIVLAVVALIVAHPLLVSAKPIPPIGPIHDRSPLAQAAQSTASPQEEPTQKPTEAPSEEPTEKPTEEPTEEPTTEPTEEPTEEPTTEPTEEPTQESTEEPTAEATEEPTQEPTEEAGPTLVAGQSSSGVSIATVIITSGVPVSTSAISGTTFALPSEWQGEEAISAEDLAKVAPPLQAEVLQGQFQIAYVPAVSGVAGEGVLRVLPLPTDNEVGTLRLALKLDPSSTVIPFPAGQTLVAQLTARVYAPDAMTSFSISDDQSSSTLSVNGLNWSDYQVTRSIAANATSLEVLLEWRNVPSNGWLELRGFKIIEAPAEETIQLSPTDTPTTGETAAIAPTTPPSPTATALAVSEAASLPTATPIPDTISGTADLTATAPFIVVTSTPTPADVYEEATRVAQATDWARILGPATPTPPNLATPTPTITPIIVTNTPVAANQATVEQMAVRATAIAFTTGTPTPLPDNATILVATDTPIPKGPTGPTARPTATATPIYVLLDNIPTVVASATPGVPADLMGKIIFLSSYRGNPKAPNAMIMNPDGTGIGLLTTNYFYAVVAARDPYSADNRFYSYSLHDSGGAAHNAGAIQIFYIDSLYDKDNSPHQLTYFGNGAAWAPSWSPTSQTVAYVSNESGNDEIYVSQLNQWPARQLTKNSYEWDHHPSFSPDGSQIVFDSNRVGGRRQLWLMSSSGENQRQLTNFTFEAWDAVWVKYVSPDVSATDTISDTTVDP